MKTLQKLFISILIISVPALLTAQDKDKNNNTETVKFVTSIHCDNCVNTIMTNLPQEKGVRDVKCDLQTKVVAVTYQKDKNSTDEIRKAIEKLGYTAKPLTEEKDEKKDK
jgi:periplasmic mercuric ion binding protein